MDFIETKSICSARGAGGGTARPAAACGARSPPPRRGAVRPRRRCVGSGVAHAPRQAASPALCAPRSGFRSPMPTLVCRRDGGGPTPPTSNARTPPGVCPAARLSSHAAPQRRRQRPRAEGPGPRNSGAAEAAGGAWGSRAAAATPPAPHTLASRNLSAPSPIGLRWRPRHTGVTDEVSLRRGLDQRMGGEFGVPPSGPGVSGSPHCWSQAAFPVLASPSAPVLSLKALP